MNGRQNGFGDLSGGAHDDHTDTYTKGREGGSFELKKKTDL